MEFVGWGDMHLDKLDGIIPDASERIVRSMTKVFDYALDHGVEHVIQYGDVGERPRLSYHAQTCLYQALLKPKYRDLQIHFILGNHDFAEDGTHTLQVMDVVAKGLKRNVHVYLKPTLVDLDGTQFNFLPHPHVTTRKDCVNVGHFEASGSLRDNGRQIDEGVNNKHVCVVGHLHTMHRVRNTHFSGTLYQTNFGESMPKFFHHCSVDKDPYSINVENVPFTPPWQLVNLTINTVDDLALIEKENNIYYKLFLKSGLDIDINEVLMSHPNVVRHNTFKTKKDLKDLVQREWDLSGDMNVEPLRVNEWETVSELLTRDGLTVPQVKRGRDIITNLRGQTI